MTIAMIATMLIATLFASRDYLPGPFAGARFRPGRRLERLVWS